MRLFKCSFDNPSSSGLREKRQTGERHDFIANYGRRERDQAASNHEEEILHNISQLNRRLPSTLPHRRNQPHLRERQLPLTLDGLDRPMHNGMGREDSRRRLRLQNLDNRSPVELSTSRVTNNLDRVPPLTHPSSLSSANVPSLLQSDLDRKKESRQFYVNSLPPDQRQQQGEWVQEQPRGLHGVFFCLWGYEWIRVKYGYRCSGKTYFVIGKLLAEGKGGYYKYDGLVKMASAQFKLTGPFYPRVRPAVGSNGNYGRFRPPIGEMDMKSPNGSLMRRSSGQRWVYKELQS
jgi:hypothetical protein